MQVKDLRVSFLSSKIYNGLILMLTLQILLQMLHFFLLLLLGIFASISKTKDHLTFSGYCTNIQLVGAVLTDLGLTHVKKILSILIVKLMLLYDHHIIFQFTKLLERLNAISCMII